MLMNLKKLVFITSLLSCNYAYTQIPDVEFCNIASKGTIKELTDALKDGANPNSICPNGSFSVLSSYYNYKWTPSLILLIYNTNFPIDKATEKVLLLFKNGADLSGLSGWTKNHKSGPSTNPPIAYGYKSNLDTILEYDHPNAMLMIRDSIENSSSDEFKNLYNINFRPNNDGQGNKQENFLAMNLLLKKDSSVINETFDDNIAIRLLNVYQDYADNIINDFVINAFLNLDFTKTREIEFKTPEHFFGTILSRIIPPSVDIKQVDLRLIDALISRGINLNRIGTKVWFGGPGNYSYKFFEKKPISSWLLTNNSSQNNPLFATALFEKLISLGNDLNDSFDGGTESNADEILKRINGVELRKLVQKYRVPSLK